MENAGLNSLLVMEEAQKENELAGREYNRENNETTMTDNLGSILSKLEVLQKEQESLQHLSKQEKYRKKEGAAAPILSLISHFVG